MAELFKLYLIARADSDIFLPAPSFALMLGYDEKELRELYEREIKKANRGNDA